MNIMSYVIVLRDGLFEDLMRFGELVGVPSSLSVGMKWCSLNFRDLLIFLNNLQIFKSTKKICPLVVTQVQEFLINFRHELVNLVRQPEGIARLVLFHEITLPFDWRAMGSTVANDLIWIMDELNKRLEPYDR